MYEIGISEQFEAAVFMVGDFGPATRVHGHTYRLEAIVQGDTLRSDGTLFNIAILQERLRALAATLHYQLLNELPAFAGRNPTVEVIADYCWRELADGLRSEGLNALTIRLWENPQAYAARSGAL